MNGVNTMREHEIPKVAVYTRVSSEEQVEEGFSLGTQHEACLARLEDIYGPNLYQA